MPQLGGGQLGGFPLAGGISTGDPVLVAVDAGTSTDTGALELAIDLLALDAGTSTDSGSLILNALALGATDAGTSQDTPRLSLTYADNGLVIFCLDPVTNKVLTFKRADRSAFKFNSTVNGGDSRASWTSSCDQFLRTGIPDLAARIAVVNTTRNKVLWLGTLRRPKEHWERGKLISIDFEAKGMADSTIRHFPEPTEFGDANYPAEVIDRMEIVDLREAMQYGISQAPLVNGTQSHVATTGITIIGNTQDFRGSTPPSLWTAICALTAQLGTPYIWMVQPDENGDPALYFQAPNPNPEYFAYANAKSADIIVDADEIRNLVYVVHGGDPTASAPNLLDSEPITYTEIPDIQTYYTDATAEMANYNEVFGFAGGLLNRYNVRRVTDGTIILDRDLRALYSGSSTPEIIPISEVRAGKTIRLTLQRTPYHASQLDVFIRSAEYDEDSCQVTLAPTAVDQFGINARLLTLLSGRLGWALMSPRLAPVGPNPLVVGYPASTSTDGATSAPATGTVMPDPKPPPPPSDGHEDPLIPVVVPPLVPFGGLGVHSMAGVDAIYGPYGGQHHPKTLPPERINIPAIFSTSDEDGELTDGERAGEDVQEVFVDTITIKTQPTGTTGTVTIKVDVFHYSDGTTDTDVFEITLTGGEYNRVILDGEPGDVDGPVLLYHGDHIIWRVEDADSDFIVKVSLGGWKNWKQFPDFNGPAWIPQA